MASVLAAMKKHEAEQARTERAATSCVVPVRQPNVRTAGEHGVAPSAAGSDGSGYSGALVAHHDRGAAITDEYRDLRDRLLDQSPDGRFCCAITSPGADEGKTVTCLNLALVMAEHVNRRTIVVDSDLRQGDMAALLNAEAEPGIADLLRGSARLNECVQPTCYPNLFFIPSGSARLTVEERLPDGPKLYELVDELRRDYDSVILDTPPIGEVPDAATLGRLTNEALIVVRMNKTRRESVDQAIRLLRAGNVERTGILLAFRR